MAKPQAQTERVLTKRQLALSRREKERLRLIYMGLGGVAALILIVLAFGLIQTYVWEPNSPVSIVNGTTITTGEYQDRVQYERFLLEDQYQELLKQQATLQQPGNEQLAQLLGGQYEQMAQQLLQQRVLLGTRQTLDDMIEEKLVEAEAQKRGITVSEEEVTEAINRYLASRSGGLTALAVTETATARAEASATAALWTPTPTFTPSPTLTSTTQLTATESLTPTATPENTPTPAPTSTPNIIGPDKLKTDYADWLKVLADKAGINEAQFRQYFTAGLLKQKLQEALGEDVPKTAEQAHARHILVETEDEAKKVVERLNQGEDFAALAKELSKDTGSGAEGGDLGFVPKGRFVKPVDDAVFSLPLHKISEPIKSDFGWHVIEVLEREERELEPLDYRRSQRQAYTDWLAEARAAANIQDFWTIKKVPADRTTAFDTPPVLPQQPQQQ
ncbi:MAG: peptidylprolyl isomerase [Anaerolineae bacterium]